MYNKNIHRKTSGLFDGCSVAQRTSVVIQKYANLIFLSSHAVNQNSFLDTYLHVAKIFI